MSERIPASAAAAAQRRAVAALRGGEVVVLPTDTVYAVVADAFNPSAMRTLQRLKGRDDGPPFSVVIRSPRQVTGLVSDIPEAADRLMAAYWPGPLTLVFPASDGLGWNLGATQGTVGLRMPTDDLLLAVVAEIGPLACSGANAPGRAAARDVDEAEEQFGSRVPLYVDGGRRSETVSTIVDVTAGDVTAGDVTAGDLASGEVRVLREGAVTAEDVRRVAAGELAWGARPQPGPAPDASEVP